MAKKLPTTVPVHITASHSHGHDEPSKALRRKRPARVHTTALRARVAYLDIVDHDSQPAVPRRGHQPAILDGESGVYRVEVSPGALGGVAGGQLVEKTAGVEV